MHFDLFILNNSVASYNEHHKTIFFIGAWGHLHLIFSIFCHENLEKYSSNVAILLMKVNKINKLILYHQKFPRSILFFTELTLPPLKECRMLDDITSN